MGRVPPHTTTTGQTNTATTRRDDLENVAGLLSSVHHVPSSRPRRAWFDLPRTPSSHTDYAEPTPHALPRPLDVQPCLPYLPPSFLLQLLPRTVPLSERRRDPSSHSPGNIQRYGAACLERRGRGGREGGTDVSRVHQELGRRARRALAHRDERWTVRGGVPLERYPGERPARRGPARAQGNGCAQCGGPGQDHGGHQRAEAEVCRSGMERAPDGAQLVPLDERERSPPLPPVSTSPSRCCPRTSRTTTWEDWRTYSTASSPSQRDERPPSSMAADLVEDRIHNGWLPQHGLVGLYEQSSRSF